MSKPCHYNTLTNGGDCQNEATFEVVKYQDTPAEKVKAVCAECLPKAERPTTKTYPIGARNQHVELLMRLPKDLAVELCDEIHAMLSQLDGPPQDNIGCFMEMVLKNFAATGWWEPPAKREQGRIIVPNGNHVERASAMGLHIIQGGR